MRPCITWSSCSGSPVTLEADHELIMSAATRYRYSNDGAEGYSFVVASQTLGIQAGHVPIQIERIGAIEPIAEQKRELVKIDRFFTDREHDLIGDDNADAVANQPGCALRIEDRIDLAAVKK